MLFVALEILLILLFASLLKAMVNRFRSLRSSKMAPDDPYSRGLAIYNGDPINKKYYKNDMACFFTFLYEGGPEFGEGMIRSYDTRANDVLEEFSKFGYMRASSHYKGLVEKNRGIDIGAVPLPNNHRTVLLAKLNNESWGIKPEAFGCDLKTPVEFLRHGVDFLKTRIWPKKGECYKKEHDKNFIKEFKEFAKDNNFNIDEKKLEIYGFSYIHKFLQDKTIEGKSPSFLQDKTIEVKSPFEVQLKTIKFDENYSKAKGNEVVLNEGFHPRNAEQPSSELRPPDLVKSHQESGNKGHSRLNSANIDDSKRTLTH